MISDGCGWKNSATIPAECFWKTSKTGYRLISVTMSQLTMSTSDWKIEIKIDHNIPTCSLTDTFHGLEKPT